MVVVQPFSSWVVVTVRPFASVAEEVARAEPRPLLLLELEETLTDEPEDAEEELVARDDDPAEDAADDRSFELFAMLLISRPSLPIRTNSQFSGVLMRGLGDAPAPSSTAPPTRA